MRRFVPIIPCILISLIACGAEAATEKSRTKLPLLPMTDWHIAPVMAENAALPDYCALVARYDNGPIITFTRNAEHVGSMTIDLQNAKLETGRQYAVTTRILKKTNRFAARAIAPTRLVLQGAETAAIFDAHGLGHPLTISLDGTSGIFKLSGNISAFFQFDHCMRALDPDVDPAVETEQSVATVQNPTVDIVPLDDVGNEISWDDAGRDAPADPNAAPDATPDNTTDRAEIAAADAMPDAVKDRLKSTLDAARAKAAPAEKEVPVTKHIDAAPVIVDTPIIKQAAPVTAPLAPAPLNVPMDDTRFNALDALGSTVGAQTPAATPTPVPVPVPAKPIQKTAAPIAAPAPIAMPARIPVPEPVITKPVVTKPTWAQRTQAFLFATGLSSATASPDAPSIAWHDRAGVTATARHDGSDDIVEVAATALDQAEGECRGQFTSQMGLPETHGAHTLQLLESKRTRHDGGTHVTTWLIDHDGHDTTVWYFATTNARAETFALRDAVYKALAESRS